MTRQVSIQAPAKLNLGLEVLGRRPDGFHDIVTIFQAISLADELTLAPAPAISLVSSDPTLDPDDNLVTAALNRLRDAANTEIGADATLTKRIPIAAGLGGASSDAAAALIAGRALWESPLSNHRLHEIARTLGSDVPFFLTAGTALGTGRGDQITPVAPLTDIWFVVVSPAIAIPRKTPTLYGLLGADDFSTGALVRDFSSVASMLREGGGLALPPNAFSRPLYTLRPDLAALPGRMAAAGATMVGLAGAGPSHYAVVTDAVEAERIANRLRAGLGSAATVAVAAPVVKPPVAVSTYLGQG